MAAARPRLHHFARAQGLRVDAAEDAVQDTLVEAWRHLGNLYTPERFDAWLIGICRNVCRRHIRSDAVHAARQISLPLPLGRDEADAWQDTPLFDIADPLAIDPDEELERHDLELLLDRALGYLSQTARDVVELCYLTDLPQREVAQRLGVTIRAVEGQLRRARKQLDHVLGSELRAQAQALGLSVGADMPAGWRETRMWCPSCGRARLNGVFETLAGGDVNLHLRCPACPHEVNSWGHVLLSDLHSFRPAYKRVMQRASAYFAPGLAPGPMCGWLPCFACGAPQLLRVARADELSEHHRRRPGVLIALDCRVCGRHRAELHVADALWSHPAAQDFMRRHPRYIAEPETLIEHQGQVAIRVRLSDILSAARLTLLAHPQTLDVLAAVRE